MLLSFCACLRIVRFKPRFNQMFKPEFKPKLKMKAAISVICYKSKTLANGEHLFLRKGVLLGISNGVWNQMGFEVIFFFEKNILIGIVGNICQPF